MIRAAVLLAIVGCQSEPAPVVAPPQPRDAAIAIDTAARCDEVATFRFGTFALPLRLCWRRTEEGDDQSGIIVDAAGTTRFTYQAFAFAKTPDVCAGTRAKTIRPGVRTCELANGHHCASFLDGLNICTIDAQTTVDDLIAP